MSPADPSALQQADQTTPFNVLVVDDERNIRRALSMILSSSGYVVHGAGSAEEAASLLDRADYPTDLLLLDLMLPKMGGLAWLAELKADALYRHIPVIVISGDASSEEAASAIKLGAIDFFEKPLNRDRVLLSAQKALDNAGLVRRLAMLSAEVDPERELIGDSPAMKELFRNIERVAPTKANVLITGPSGTGKELASRAIHRLSPRSAQAFIKVNCAAIPRELIESELFGHEKGSFTGAEAKKRGVFEQAHGSTLFLDEIGDMDLAAQAKVLRVLQSGELCRVGSEHIFHVDVRVLAATNKELAREVAEGRFREDLFFRLNVFPLLCPTLNERIEDIPLLVKAFSERFCEENGIKMKPIDSEVYAALKRRSWPGNVRELKNVVERAIILAGEQVTIADLPEDPHIDPFEEVAILPPPAEGAERATLRDVRSQAERQHIIATLMEFDWNVSRTAVALGVERTNLHKKIRAYGIQRGENN